MDKKFVKTVSAVVLGLCVLIMLYSFVSLIYEAALADDVKKFSEAVAYEVIYFVKWSATGLVCLLVPAFASAAFAYFGKNKILPIIAAVMFFFVGASAIGILSAVKELGVKNSVPMAAATAYMQELLQLAIPAILIGAYFILVTVKAFTAKKEPLQEEAANEESV